MTDQIMIGIVFGVIATVAVVGALNIIHAYLKEKEESRQREIDILIRAIDKLEIKTIRLEREVDSLKGGNEE